MRPCSHVIAPDLLCIAGPFLELIPPEEVQDSIDVLTELTAGNDVVGHEHRTWGRFRAPTNAVRSPRGRDQ